MSDINFRGNDWREVVKRLDAEIATWDVMNRDPSLDHDKTQVLRAKIQLAESIKGWAKEGMVDDAVPEYAITLTGEMNGYRDH